MSHRTLAKVVADSIPVSGPESLRLTSMYVIFPKMILGERNRHRAFSLSDRSSRAVPPEKLIEEVREDPAMPAQFRKRIKGMGGGDLLEGRELEDAQGAWRYMARSVANMAERWSVQGLAKEIVNRPLDPFIRMHSLMTATRDGWMNFFGLRLDENADPTIQRLAQKCYTAYTESKPDTLSPGDWHLPFCDLQVETGINGWSPDHIEGGDGETYSDVVEYCLKLSAARCAHLSYNDLETGRRMTLDRAVAIYDKLTKSRPLHASPLEHQATPDTWRAYLRSDEREIHGNLGEWENPLEHGNLPGWRQARKMLPGEAVAPLPEGFEI